ncbi:MAG: methyltransferase domain-containing protein [Melioribacteraceae bacterium]|nr:methyltransferase domain-containing protein [Melioribacteraceae bacterium]
MKNNSIILLPGLDRQIAALTKNVELNGKNILVVGSSSEIIALRLQNYSGNPVEMIVEDYDSFMNSRMVLSGKDDVILKIMDFEHTDYKDGYFDLIYAQASAGDTRRKGIIKEFLRLLKTDGLLCLGEITSFTENPPKFVRDIFAASQLAPLLKSEVAGFYRNRNFEVLHEFDFSRSLSDYYRLTLDKLNEIVGELSTEEKAYYKKLINKISHESKSYLNSGADKYIGFVALILRKNG